MFDVGILEMAVIAVVALLVFGPDRLPAVAREAGEWLRRARGLVSQARQEVTETIGVDLATDPRKLVTDALLGEDATGPGQTGEDPASPGGGGVDDAARGSDGQEGSQRRHRTSGSFDDVS